MIKHNFKAVYYHYKDRDTLIEQSPVTSTQIESTLIKQSQMFVGLEKCEQNLNLSSKILSKIGQKKIAGKKNRWEIKSKIDLSLIMSHNSGS